VTALVFDAASGRYACRAGCGACCIALSISSPIPGMPDGNIEGLIVY
jgi:Fe-S-cluster containining protein